MMNNKTKQFLLSTIDENEFMNSLAEATSEMVVKALTRSGGTSVEAPLHISKIAEILDLSVGTIREYIANGILPGHQLMNDGKVYLYLSEVREALLKKKFKKI